MPSGGAIGLFLVAVGVVSTVWVLVAFFGGVLLYVLLGRDGGDGGRTRSGPDRGTAKISHRCETRGEKYYAPGSDISACRNCGAIKVEELA